MFIYSNYSLNRYENLYNNIKDNEFIVKVVSEKSESNYNYRYKCIVLGKNKKFKNTKIYVYVNKKEDYNYGDILKLKGLFEYAKEQRNSNGFNYRRTLWQDKIFGIIRAEVCLKISTDNSCLNKLFLFKQKIKYNIETIFDDNSAEFLKSILIGDKAELSDDIKENFKNANLMHIIAISGFHISQIILFLDFSLFFINSLKIKKFINCFLIFSFVFMIGNTPSSVRASLMYYLVVFSDLFHRKTNSINNLFWALFFVLIINPFYIENIGVWLSFAGTAGIILINPILNNKKFKNRYIDYIYKCILISVSVNIFIFPIILYTNSTFSLTFFISNIFVSLFIAPIMFTGFLISLIGKKLPFLKIWVFVENKLIVIILCFSKIISKIPLSKIYVKTPYLINIISYYLIVFLVIFKKMTKKILCVIICSIIILNILILGFNKFNNNLTITFLDVGQGDCTIIKTINNKTILIDGGEGYSEKYDEGKNTVLPYLLDKRIIKIDYIIISHFDSDHVGGLLTIMEELNVENVIISKQIKDSDNYKIFLDIVKEKRINVIIIESGKRLKIEKKLYFDFLWPDNSNYIQDNPLNNNSIVCKMIFNNISILFTGDIEEISEREIVKKYGNLNVLNSTILKVAHHGSKTSSSEKFISLVQPKYALIGVEKNNKFGHPNERVIKILQNNKTKIFRTDQDGEIRFVINKNGKIIRILKKYDTSNTI